MEISSNRAIKSLQGIVTRMADEPASKKQEQQQQIDKKPAVWITTYLNSSHCSGKDAPSDAHIESQSADRRSYEGTTDNLFGNLKKSREPRIDLSQIRGPNGSVRGHKNVVKKSLEVAEFQAASSRRNFSAANLDSFKSMMHCLSSRANSDAARELGINSYREDEDQSDLCIAYTTTLGIIRRTYEDSKLAK